MKAFGFLSSGHYDNSPAPQGPDARQMLHDAADIAVGAEEVGANGAYFRVHHFAPQAASPMPLLSYVAGKTSRIEVGTGVVDMRYENPLYLAEEAAALDLLSDGRLALGVSRGSPEAALRGWEAFGYQSPGEPKGEKLARQKFEQFLHAIDGNAVVEADPAQFGEGRALRVEPYSPGLRKHVWWGAGTRGSAVDAARQGVNLMSSTLLTEATGDSFSELQAEQIRQYRAAWKEAGHAWTPRVSVSRSVFPVVSDQDRRMFGYGGGDGDQIATIDGLQATFGRTYLGTPEELVMQLQQDAAVMESDTLMLAIPSQLGVDLNVRILENFAQHVAPELGWKPNTEGPVEGYPLN